MEELPLSINTDQHEYNVLKSPVAMGCVRARADVHNQAWFLLSTRLQCLSAGVTHALLIISPYCIAVFRDKSGRYGLFDSHCRNADGLPNGNGKAVMITFTHLSELVARIYTLYELLLTDSRGPIDGLQYDFMPVAFQNVRHLSTCKTSDCLPFLSVQSDKPQT